jgi:FixJ family two-component response regulator
MDGFRRRKEIYDRFQAGETAKEIADDLGISMGRVYQLKSDWQSYLKPNRLPYYQKTLVERGLLHPRSPEYGYA